MDREEKIEDYTIYYTLSTDPERFDYLNEDTVTSLWTTDELSDLTTIKGIKIVTSDNFVLNNYETLNVYINMGVTDDFKNNTLNTTFSFRANEVLNNLVLPIESLSTSIVNSNEIKIISGFSWLDNLDRIYESGEEYLENLEIELYDNAKKILNTTFTDINGKYIFDDLYDGEYYLKVVVPENYFITKQVIDNEFGSKVSEKEDYNLIALAESIDDYNIGLIKNEYDKITLIVKNTEITLDSVFDPLDYVEAYDIYMEKP